VDNILQGLELTDLMGWGSRPQQRRQQIFDILFKYSKKI